MACNSITVAASPDAAFSVLDDAYAYPRWVVGARRVRRVDRDWPSVGSRFHHAVGNAAGELHDSSKVLERDPPHRIVLEVRFRPTGIARVEIEVVPDGEHSILTLSESPTDGPITRLPPRLVDALVWIRNALSLQRLRHEIERRARRNNQGSSVTDAGPE